MSHRPGPLALLILPLCAVAGEWRTYTLPAPIQSGAVAVAQIHREAKPMPDLSGRGQAVVLQNGAKGWFIPVSCGGSCAPATLYWQMPAASYWIQMKFDSSVPASTQLKVLLDTVNSAKVAE